MLAAGQGSRLESAGPKALLEVGGQPLIRHATEQLRNAGADPIFCVANSQVAPALYGALQDEPRVHVVVKDTPSALGTFAALLDLARPHRFLFIAVDSLLPPEGGRIVVERLAGASTPPLVLGLVPAQPGALGQLRAEVDAHDRVVQLATSDSGSWVTAGLYGGRSKCLPPVPDAQAKWGLRDYLGWLVADGMPVSVVRLPWGFDVDTPADAALARTAWAATPPIER